MWPVGDPRERLKCDRETCECVTYARVRIGSILRSAFVKREKSTFRECAGLNAARNMYSITMIKKGLKEKSFLWVSNIVTVALSVYTACCLYFWDLYVCLFVCLFMLGYILFMFFLNNEVSY